MAKPRFTLLNVAYTAVGLAVIGAVTYYVVRTVRRRNAPPVGVETTVDVPAEGRRPIRQAKRRPRQEPAAAGSTLGDADESGRPLEAGAAGSRRA